jgi:hypothetical protein
VEKYVPCAVYTGTNAKKEEKMSRELEVLREEYWRVRANPIFDNPADYCILLDLIIDRIEVLEGGEDNNG